MLLIALIIIVALFVVPSICGRIVEKLMVSTFSLSGKSSKKSLSKTVLTKSYGALLCRRVVKSKPQRALSWWSTKKKAMIDWYNSTE